jgi:hypothetical protein
MRPPRLSVVVPVIGEYVEPTYVEARRRPLFIVNEIVTHAAAAGESR